jgi:membrane complex biogenesis BtpA family protein
VKTRLDLNRRPVLIGMVHLLGLPGSPGARPMRETLARALSDARVWRRHGADALLVENYGDRPWFPDAAPPVTVAAMARICAALVAEVGGPIGVNVLRNDARAALAIAAACELDFIRVNVHSGVAVTDQGLLAGRAHETLRERMALRPSVRILADLRVKHSAPLAARPLADEARELSERAGADALLVTGPATGAPPDPAEVEAVVAAVPGIPVLIASGVDPALIAATRARVAGWIVGTSAKRGGVVEGPPDPRKVRALTRARGGA